MIEKKELGRIACQGEDGRSLTVVRFQFFETEETAKGARKRPGAIGLALTSGEALRQVDEGCFELIETGELITAAPDAGSDASDRENAPLCHYEELAWQENRMWEARRKASLPDDHTDQAASNSSAGPKNS
ncbi:MAG: hypothetical protein KJZ64_11525 [Sphingomonadaceae bacterium]|nr:hypothetical protein [Sphingomonadaceae bacterium]